MSDSKRVLPSDLATNLHAPLATLIIGVTGNNDPEGYDAKVHSPMDASPEIQKIYLRVWQFLDWIFGSETQSPLGFPSERLSQFGVPKEVGDLSLRENDPRLENRCEFLSGMLEEFHACWKPLGIKHTPVVLLSSISPGIDTLVAEVFLDYRKFNPDRSVFVRVPLPFPVECIERCSSYRTEDDRVRLRQLLGRLRAQDGWEEQRDLFCVKMDNDWEPLQPIRKATDDRSGKDPLCHAVLPP